MRFLERMALVVKADAHGVVDQLEERSLLVKQHLREAELELGRKRARCEALEEEERRLRADAERLAAEVAALDEDVSLALSGGKDELARFAVRRLLPRRRAVEAARERAASLAETRARLREKLAEQERAFEELQTRARARLAALAQEDGERPAMFAAEPVADEEVELELLRRTGSAQAGGAGRSS
jgi:phage shock protein A